MNAQQVMETIAGLVGTVVGGIIAFIDTNPNILKYGLAFVGLAAVVIASVLVVKAVRWVIREIISAVRSVVFRIRLIRMWLMRRPTMKRMKGKFMAKWKNGLVADIIGDAIFEAQMKGTLSDQEGKEISIKIGKALGLTDLLPRRFSKAYLNWYFKGGKDKQGKPVAPAYQKLEGPRQGANLGPKPGEGVKTEAKNVVQSEMLERMRQKKAG